MIKENLFDLSPEEVTASKGIYSDKIIKCLVAPYHTYEQLEKEIKYTPSTFLFPEREMNIHQIAGFISMVVASDITEEFRIITANQNIIMDMIGTSVRILTEPGEIVQCPVKTFMANIHDIRYSVLENKDHQISDEQRHLGNKRTREIMESVDKALETGVTNEQYAELANKIQLIGEPIITNSLMDRLYKTKLLD